MSGCVYSLLPCSKLPHNAAASHNAFVVHLFCGSGVQAYLCWDFWLRLWSGNVPGCSYFHTQLGKDLFPSSLTRLLARCCVLSFWFFFYFIFFYIFLWAVGLRTSVLHWQLSNRPPSVSCHTGLSIGQLTTWQSELERKQERARKMEVMAFV